VEQTETPAKMEKRIAEWKAQGKKVDKNDKVVNRAIVKVVTKGTFQSQGIEDQGYEPRWVLAFKQEGQTTFGVSFFDVNLLKIYVGQFEDNA
jgi:DNA mismatch repair ATPase MutS